MKALIATLLLGLTVTSQALDLRDVPVSPNVERQTDPGPAWVKKNCPRCSGVMVQEYVSNKLKVKMLEGALVNRWVYGLPDYGIQLSFSNLTKNSFIVTSIQGWPFSLTKTNFLCQHLFPKYRTMAGSKRLTEYQGTRVLKLTCYISKFRLKEEYPTSAE